MAFVPLYTNKKKCSYRLVNSGRFYQCFANAVRPTQCDGILDTVESDSSNVDDL